MPRKVALVHTARCAVVACVGDTSQKNFFCLSQKFVSPSVRTSWNTLSPLQKIISLSAGYSCLAYWKGCQCALVDPAPHGPRKEAITGIHVHLFKVGLFETKILIKWRFCKNIFFPRSAVLRVVPLSCCTLVERGVKSTYYRAARKSEAAAKIECAEKLRYRWKGRCVRLVSLFGEYLLVFEFLCWPLLLMKQTIYDCQGFPSGWGPENKKCFMQIITLFLTVSNLNQNLW